MKKAKILIAMLMTVCMLLPMLAGLTVAMAADTTPSVTTDKTTYVEGEAIMVTGTGDAAAKDWIGIQPKDDTGYSIYWYYITEENNGQPVNIAEQEISNRTDPDDYNLPAGEYVVYFVPANGYASQKTLTTFITITEKVVAAPTEFSYTLTDATSGWAAGSGSVASASPAVVLYWGDANGKLANQDPLGYYRVKDGTATVEVEAGIPVPAMATRLLAYGYDDEVGAESKTCAAVTLPENCQAWISTNKMVYEIGEPILATAKTDNLTRWDWIGVSYAGQSASILYYYVTGETAEKPVDLTGTEAPLVNNAGSSSPWPEIVAGSYDISWVAANDYLYKRSFYFTIEVVEEKNGTVLLDPPAAPTNAVYELENDTDGMADGTLTVTLPEGHNASDIVMYWADDSGKLSGYTALSKFKVASDVTEVVHEMTANTLIPAGTTKLLIYTLNKLGASEECFTVTLPEGAASKDFGTLIDEFQVVSDIHLTEDNAHEYNQNFLRMLQDIAANSPNSSGIYVNGDMANSGSAVEYENMWAMYESVEGLPAMYLALGNHDLYNHEYEEGINLFLENVLLEDGSHPEKAYYDIWKNGYHFIFLASDEEMSGGTVFTEEQMTWLREKLNENRDPARPAFVFIHTPLYNTVSGSLEGEGWHGVYSENLIRPVLKDFPEVVLFSGHTHWHLDSKGTMFERTDKLPTMFNTAAVAYLWDGYNVITGENMEGSQGYYLRVYEDKLLVLGRNFATGEWISSAQFVVDFSELKPQDETPDQPGDSTGEPLPGDTAPTTEPADGDEGSKLPVIIGCIAGGAVVIAAAVVIVVVGKKKKWF